MKSGNKNIVIILLACAVIVAVGLLGLMYVRRNNGANESVSEYISEINSQEDTEEMQTLFDTVTETETVGQKLSNTETDTLEFVEKEYVRYKTLELSDYAAEFLDDDNFIRAMDYMLAEGFSGYVYVQPFKSDDSEGGLLASDLVCNYAGDAEYYYIFADDEHVYDVIVEGDEIFVDEFIEW